MIDKEALIYALGWSLWQEAKEYVKGEVTSDPAKVWLYHRMRIPIPADAYGNWQGGDLVLNLAVKTGQRIGELHHVQPGNLSGLGCVLWFITGLDGVRMEWKNPDAVAILDPNGAALIEGYANRKETD